MTPEERNLVTELFDRLATLEDAERDPEAERAIKDGLRQAPNAIYALVQTALVQDEALKRADAHIRDLEAQVGAPAQAPRSGSFLGNMRDALTGRRGSVPPVPATDAPMGVPADYRSPSPPMSAPPAGSGNPGGSFLGTAAATAAGMIGGSLLLDSIRGMMGHHGMGSSGGSLPRSGISGDPGSPWGSSSGGGGNLAREAGIDEIRPGHDDGGASKGETAFDSDEAGDEVQEAGDGDDQDADDFDDNGDDFDTAGDFGDDGGDVA